MKAYLQPEVEKVLFATEMITLVDTEENPYASSDDDI